MVSPLQSQTTVFAVLLYGVNIPEGRWLKQRDLQLALQGLNPGLEFLRIVGDTDNILLRSTISQSHFAIQGLIENVLGIQCVAIEINVLRALVKQSLDYLGSLGYPLVPPYHVSVANIVWEFGLVISSESLPGILDERNLLFERKKNVIPLRILRNRALLVQKRKQTASGGRVMFGRILIDPWKKVLEKNGINPGCLTSRSLGRAEEMVKKAGI